MSYFLSFQAIAEFKQGKVEYRADKTGIVHLPFGKVYFPEEDLLVNLLAAIVCSSFLSCSSICISVLKMQVAYLDFHNVFTLAHMAPS